MILQKFVINYSNYYLFKSSYNFVWFQHAKAENGVKIVSLIVFVKTETAMRSPEIVFAFQDGKEIGNIIYGTLSMSLIKRKILPF